MFDAGFTPQEIAEEFSMVFRWTGKGLTQRYNKDATRDLHRRDPIAKECGLKETNMMVSSGHVTELIKRRAV